MENVKISPNFEISIPALIQEELGLKAGQELQICVRNGCIEIRPIRSLESLRGAAKGMKWKGDYRDRRDRY